MTKPPNILVLMTDQQRFDSLGCYGNAHAMTPNLDRMAARGALFTTCYVQNPVCSPSRATFATGLYPRNHGLWANGVALPAGQPLLSKALADAGYDCGMVGKQHLGPMAGLDEEPRLADGYRVYRWSHGPNHPSKVNAFHAWLRERHPAVYASAIANQPPKGVEGNNSSKTPVPLNAVPVEAHYSHWIAQETIDFIEDASRPAGTPFYFMANFFDPHHPFGAPEAVRSRFDASTLPSPSGSPEDLDDKPEPLRAYSRRSYAGHAPGFVEYSAAEVRELIASYYAMIALIDAEVGRILQALERRGELDNTLIVFTSDHGEMLGDHGLLLKGPMLFEPAVRVPLILHRPGAIAGGTRISSIVQTIDLTSTILAAAGIPRAFRTQGSDLMPLIAQPGMPWRDWALCEYRDSGHSFAPPLQTTMLRHRHHKLIVWHGEPAGQRQRDGELYDLEADPGEHRNLFHDERHARTREAMKDILLDVSASIEWPVPPRTAAW
jgi:arylsulfatase A-like enzyme